MYVADCLSCVASLINNKSNPIFWLLAFLLKINCNKIADRHFQENEETRLLQVAFCLIARLFGHPHPCHNPIKAVCSRCKPMLPDSPYKRTSQRLRTPITEGRTDPKRAICAQIAQVWQRVPKAPVPFGQVYNSIGITYFQ